MKILKAFNAGTIYLVLDKDLDFRYSKKGNLYIGQCGPFYTFLRFQHDPYAKAFAGREFEITMVDGEKVKCNGKHWHAEPREIDGERLTCAAAGGIDSLKKCYVYQFVQIKEKDLKTLCGETIDEIGYWEVKKKIKDGTLLQEEKMRITTVVGDPYKNPDGTWSVHVNVKRENAGKSLETCVDKGV